MLPRPPRACSPLTALLLTVAIFLIVPVAEAMAKPLRSRAVPATGMKHVAGRLDLSTPATVAAPAGPDAYTVPAGAVTVSSSAQLVAALANGPKAIVLTNGTYSSSTVFEDTTGTSIYAQNLGGAVLTAGLMIGGNSGDGGATIQGLAFDVKSPSATFQGAEIDIWGPAGADTHVLDSTFDGNWSIAVGVLALNPDGLVAQRLQLTSFTDVGIRASDNKEVAYGQPTPVIDSISDISIDGVSRNLPGSSNGTAEAGLWIGHPVKDGVHRIKIRNVAISGIETVDNSWNTTFSDLDIDMSGPHASSGIAVYLEHRTINDLFTNFSLTGVKSGFNAEWDNGARGNAAAHNDTITNGTIDNQGWKGSGNTAGINLDAGSDTTTVTNVTFKNQSWAAIGVFQNTGNNTFTNNVFQMASSAVQVSTSHI